MSDKLKRRSSRGARRVVAMLVAGLAVLCAPAAAADLTLDAAVHNPQRSAKFIARDGARHPLEELAFFGVTPQSTVVEIWPGGGWITILSSSAS